MISSGLDSSLLVAAHELKTPLVLLRQLGFELEQTEDSKRKKEIIQQMRLVSERSLRLVNNLTKMARLDDALFELEPIQLNNICREVVNEARPLSRLLKQDFSCSFSQKNMVVVANRDLFRSLLLGLIDNAFQYNSKGKNIRIITKIQRGKAIVSVRDFGETIDLNEFRRLSQAIDKQNVPISGRPLSSGLGLLIAERFARAMRGDFRIQRHYSGGMTFSLVLPLSSQLSFWDVR